MPLSFPAFAAILLLVAAAVAADAAGDSRNLDAARGYALLASRPVVTLAAGEGERARGTPAAAAAAGVLVVRREAGAPESPLPLEVTGEAPWWPGDGPLADIRLVFYADPVDPEAAAAKIAALPGIAFAEPYLLPRTTALPDDPLVPDQWYLEALGLPAAWDLARGEAAPVPVAVVDGGFYATHPDLAANILLNDDDPPNGVDDDGNGFIDDTGGWNFAAAGDDLAALAGATPLSVRHGTHVAGLVSAVTDNGAGMAGSAWNTPLLGVAVGHPVQDETVLFGYQGMLYAAERGARIINCSWGQLLRTSLLERAVVERVIELGAVIVAAAGNNAYPFPFYPAAYPEVIAVANVDAAGSRHPTSNYGLWVDLAAPGTGILSLFEDGGTGELTGTSMASPLVAGYAALLWGLRPELTPAALRHRIRVSALPAATGDGVPELGHGLARADRALLWQGPGLRLSDPGLTDGDGDGIPTPGEVLNLLPVFRNLLDAAPGAMDLRLELPMAGGVVLDAETALPPVDAGAAVVAGSPLSLRLDATLAPGTRLPLLLSWTMPSPALDDGGLYVDHALIEILVAPLYADLRGGEVDLSRGANGRIGFVGRGGGSGDDGLGVSYESLGSEHGEGAPGSLLFEGALMVGVGPARISDAARYAPNGAFHPTFTADGPPQAEADYRLEDGTRVSAVSAAFTDAGALDPLDLRIGWRALAPDPVDHPGLALILTTLVNAGTDTLRGLSYGFFLDWDLGDGGFFPTYRANNVERPPGADWSLVTRADVDDGKSVATALLPQGAEAVRLRAIDNVGGNPWQIYDGFTDDEKWDALAGSDGAESVLATDISQVLAAGPAVLAPGDSLRAVLVMAAGFGRAEAETHVRDGLALAARVLAERTWTRAPTLFSLGLPRPNPARADFLLPVSGNPLEPWQFMVYDLRGRLVHRSRAILPSGAGVLAWTGRDAAGRPLAAGVYLLRAGQGGDFAVRRVTLLR